MKQDRIAALFDFDKTLVEVESGKMGFKWLKDHQMLPLGFFFKVLIANLFYRVHLISEERMVKVLLSFYRKRRLADLESMADEFYQTYLKPHLSPRMLARLSVWMHWIVPWRCCRVSASSGRHRFSRWIRVRPVWSTRIGCRSGCVGIWTSTMT